MPRKSVTFNVPEIENFRSNNGNDVPNQFKIYTDKGVIFQSYSSIIAIKLYGGPVILDKNKWDYSQTTGKYRNQFLNETKKETEESIKSGIYKLADLNKGRKVKVSFKE